MNRKIEENQAKRQFHSFNIFKLPRSLGKPWHAMAFVIILAACLLIFLSSSTLFVSVASTHAQSGNCHFPAVFNFGDSNSDTGNFAAAFPPLTFPYGKTFLGTLSGRYSDGRLIIDFLADELGIPYLSAYLNFLASNFMHGANFAASGSTVENLYAKGFSPFPLDIQISQFEHF